MIDNVISTVKGVISVITGGIKGILGKFFVVDGYITSTTKTEDTKVKSDLKSKENADLSDEHSNYWSEQWEKIKNTADMAWNSTRTAFYAAGNTLKDIFWTLHVNAWKNIVTTYERYWNSASERFDPVKQANVSKELKKKKEKLTIDLAKIASVIPGFEAIMQIVDLLNEFTTAVSSSYQDLSDPKIDPTAPIQSLLSLIEPIAEAFKSCESFAGSAIPAGLLELPKLLDMLLQANQSSSTKKKTIRKWSSEIPSKFKDAIDACCEAMKTIPTKCTSFILLIICKILELVCKALEALGAGEIPGLKQLISIIKILPNAYALVTEGPLAFKVILEGTIRKLSSIGTDTMFDVFPDEIDIKLNGTSLVSATNVEPTLEDLEAAEKEYGKYSDEANEIRDAIEENNLIDKYGSTENRAYIAYEQAYEKTLAEGQATLDADLEKFNNDYLTMAADAGEELLKGTNTPLNDQPTNVAETTEQYSEQTNLSLFESATLVKSTETMPESTTVDNNVYSSNATSTPNNDADVYDVYIPGD